MSLEALRASILIPAPPTTVYLAWLDSGEHTAMTGGAAKIDSSVGGKFTAWDGYISGKLIQLDLGRRIVASWRTKDFPRDAKDSRLEVHLEAVHEGTRVTVLHSEIPAGQGEKYRDGWHEKYFAPMRRYFAESLPDPRKPVPKRVVPAASSSSKLLPTAKKGKAPPAKPAAKAAPVKAAPAKKAPVKAPAKKAPAKAPAKKAPVKAPAKKAPAKAPAKKAPAKAPAKKAPAKAPAKKAPAKKAPAKMPAKKAPAKAPGKKKR
ncbi:MAG: SRPBCC domain-containing protein [Myxococcales bacterium]|nr:SRPBCC domain-containing protein [Myxococcales bacterium]